MTNEALIAQLNDLAFYASQLANRANDIGNKSARIQTDDLRRLQRAVERANRVQEVAKAASVDLPVRIKSDIEEYISNNPGLQHDPDLSQHSVESLFEMYLNWNGIINYGNQLINALDAIRAFKGVQ